MSGVGETTVRRPAVMALTLAVGAVLLLALFALIGRALDDRTSRTEARFMRHVEQGSSSLVTAIAKVLSTLGSQAVLIPVVIVVSILLVVRGRSELAVVVAVSALGAIVLSNLAKALVDRPRPPAAHRLAAVASSSFPSGHATQAAAILPALALAAIAFGASRAIAWTIALIGVLAIGLSRVVLGVHYPTDVLAGWLLGGIWVTFTVKVVTTGWPRRDRRSVPAAAPST